jgi:tetratricopeptide (TPR) repeat protein
MSSSIFARPQVDEAARDFEQGRQMTWSAATRGEGIALLKRACALDRRPDYCSEYAEVLSWKNETRPQAVAELREVVAAHPEYTPARLKEAKILSWNERTRPEALRIFDEGLARDPHNSELLIASAEVLSWSRATRRQAEARYDEALNVNPNDARALAGKAQIQAWQGKSDAALALYDKALAKDPQNAAALRGKAEILNWKGHYAEARALAAQAQEADPQNQQTNLELARAEVGLHHFAAAQSDLNQAGGGTDQDIQQVRREVNRGLGTYLDVEYDLRRNHRNLDYDRFLLALSTPLNSANRATFFYSPSLFGTTAQNFNGSYFGAALDSELSDRARTHVQIGADTYPNAPTAIDAAFDWRYKLTQAVNLKAGFERAPVEESLLSTRGEKFGGTEFGQVRSNLVDLGAGYENSAHHYDLSLDYTDGVYTGENLDANRRWGVSVDAGKQLRSDHPFIRAGYDLTYLSFDHDADIQTGQPVNSQVGGYFSPTEFLANQGVLNLGYNFGRKVEWSADGTAGVQNVETKTASFGSAQFASSFNTRMLWRLNGTNDVRLGYEYLNVFNAFQRNLFKVGWRHYF